MEKRLIVQCTLLVAVCFVTLVQYNNACVFISLGCRDLCFVYWRDEKVLCHKNKRLRSWRLVRRNLALRR